MTIKVAVPRERAEGEQRVALVPDVAKRLQKLGVSISMEQNAALASGVPDSDFVDVSIKASQAETLQDANIILTVQPPTPEEVATYPEQAVWVGYMNPYNNPELVKAMAARGITSFAVELFPRISRAQSMDALSSQASAAGYKAVLMAANLSSKFFPMLTTAAGTIRPSKVLIIGVGVAGLQAIATARRLGAIVEAYDIRPSSREEVESLGARFVDTGVNAEGEGGYARELTAEEKKQQADVLAKHVAAADAVITTAAIPGKPSPKIISEEMVNAMKPGAVIIDLGAEGGGNCVLTQPGETIEHNHVLIHGPLNVPSSLAVHTSEMYARNLFNFLQLIIHKSDEEEAECSLGFDWEDQILAESVVTKEGEICHSKISALVSGEA